MVEIYLLLLTVLGFSGCLVLCRAYWIDRRGISMSAWLLASVAWGWLFAGELLWNVVGWGNWVTQLPRASIFRVLMVGAIWLLVLVRRRRRRERR